MAGVAIAMTDHAQLDVGYRFLDLGPITGISSVTRTSVTQRVRANEVRAGVRAFDLMRLAASHFEGERVAFSIRAEMNFGREAAARAAERLLFLIPPFTPAAC